MEVQVEGIWPIVGGWYLGGLNSRIMRSRGRPAAGGTVRAGTWGKRVWESNGTHEMADACGMGEATRTRPLQWPWGQKASPLPHL